MVRLIVNVDVDDLEKAVEFYRRAIGLTLTRRLFEDSTAEMRGASSTIYLAVKPAGSSPAPGTISERDYRRHWTPVHMDFVVDDIEAAVTRAEEAGATLERGINTYGSFKEATLSDPFGNGFCLLEAWPF
jgi:predicted enzyme related to lactoylglutathione lyase